MEEPGMAADKLTVIFSAKKSLVVVLIDIRNLSIFETCMLLAK